MPKLMRESISRILFLIYLVQCLFAVDCFAKTSREKGLRGRFRLPSFYNRTPSINSLAGTLGECNGGRISFVSSTLKDKVDPTNVLQVWTFTSKDILANGALDRVVKDSRTGLSAPPVRALLVFGEHGRELVSSEIAASLARMICKPSTVQEQALVDWIAEHAEIKIVPVLNEYSRQQVEKGTVCHRKNQNAVDLNRNWGYLFGTMNHPRGSEEYPGPEAFSEAQSRILRDLATEWEPSCYINIHSGEYSLYMPYDGTSESIPNPEPMMSVLQSVGRSCPKCAIGAAGAVAEYQVFGSSMDYMYAVVDVPYSFTYEVFVNETAGTNDCFGIFNPQSSDDLLTITTYWSILALGTIESTWFRSALGTAAGTRTMDPDLGIIEQVRPVQMEGVLAGPFKEKALGLIDASMAGGPSLSKRINLHLSNLNRYMVKKGSASPMMIFAGGATMLVCCLCLFVGMMFREAGLGLPSGRRYTAKGE